MSKAEEARIVTAIAASKWPQIVAALAGKLLICLQDSFPQVCDENIFCMYFITVEISSIIFAFCLTLVVTKIPIFYYFLFVFSHFGFIWLWHRHSLVIPSSTQDKK